MKHRLLFAPLLALILLLGACAIGPGTPQLVERQAKALAIFAERCKTTGEKIHRTVEDVEGIYLLKLRSSEINYEDQFKLDDPYGRDLGGDGYIETFLRGSFQAGSKGMPLGGPPRLGYQFVEAIEPVDGVRYRYRGGRKAVGKMDVNAPNVKVDLERETRRPWRDS